MTDTQREMTLRGCGVVVTGASSGLGRATALLLASLGADVLVVARRADRLSELADAPSAEGRIVPFPADISDPRQINDVVQSVATTIGRVDLLVNNAAFEIRGPIDRLSDQDFEQMWNVNVVAVIRCTRALLPFLRETRGGIVNLGSTVVDRPPKGRFGYVTTKGAIEALTKALAIDLGSDGIRVNLIRPGIVPSELRGLNEDQERTAFASSGVLDIQALPIVGDASDVAGAVAWLAGNGGRWITGAVIDVDGGFRLGNS